MARPTKGYYNEHGKRVPSVTTVLGRFKDPGALMYWSHGVAFEVLTEAHALLKNRDVRESEIRDFLRSNPLERGNYRAVSKKACDAGHVAHDLVEMWIHANKTVRSNMARVAPRTIATNNKTTMEIAKAAHNSFQAFLRWVSVNKFELYETEVPLVSEEHNYGGTLDCLGEVNGKYCLLDWKTSKSLYADYLLQLAAYGIIWDEHYDPAIEEYHLIRFDKLTGDFQHFYSADLEDCKKAFLMMREVYGLMKQIEKRV